MKKKILNLILDSVKSLEKKVSAMEEKLDI